MITNFETNKAYLPWGLANPRFQDAGLHLVNALHRNKVPFEMLPMTESPFHIWARDCMPIQVTKDKFVRFRYEPDYLADAPEYKPNTTDILSSIGMEVVDSDIILDGGNAISCGNKVILTEKIFQENPHYTRTTLVNKLEKLLEAELVLIPWDRYEEYGHSDGMVRYMGEGRVLLNNYCDFDKSLRRKLLSVLSPHFDVEELHYETYTKYSWAYINFLHVGKLIFVPMLEDRLAEKAIRQISNAFPGCDCIPVYAYDSVVSEGGAINCTTWNILADIEPKPDELWEMTY